MLIVRPLDVGQPLQQPALRDFQGPYINNYPGRYLSVHRIRSKYLSITLDPGHYFLKHWMRVLPIAESPRGGFIPYSKYCDLIPPWPRDASMVPRRRR